MRFTDEKIFPKLLFRGGKIREIEFIKAYSKYPSFFNMLLLPGILSRMNSSQNRTK